VTRSRAEDGAHGSPVNARSGLPARLTVKACDRAQPTGNGRSSPASGPRAPARSARRPRGARRRGDAHGSRTTQRTVAGPTRRPHGWNLGSETRSRERPRCHWPQDCRSSARNSGDGGRRLDADGSLSALRDKLPRTSRARHARSRSVSCGWATGRSHGASSP
jgi:hypothetical protein